MESYQMATQLALTPTWPHAYINIYMHIPIHKEKQGSYNYSHTAWPGTLFSSVGTQVRSKMENLPKRNLPR